MKMTKQHFEAIADAIRTAPTVTNRNDGRHYRTARDLAEHFADTLAGSNPLFDRGKFIARATGIKVPK